MASINNKIIGMAAVLVGIVLICMYIFNYLYIEYYSSIGLSESVSAFCLSVLLFLGGVLMLTNKGIGKYLIAGYLIGTIIDRLIVTVTYFSSISIDVLIVPLVGVLIIGAIWIVCNIKLSYESMSLWITCILVGLIAVVPKLIW